MLETSHQPGFSPLIPQHLLPLPKGAAPCVPGTVSLCSVIFPLLLSANASPRLPAYLSLSLSFGICWKKGFCIRKCGQIKREMERSTLKLARQPFFVQDQGPNSAFIALDKNLDNLSLN